MRNSEALAYTFAVLFGIGASTLEITVGDILSTALFVLVSTLVLGCIWPRRPWRWIAIVGVFVPLARMFAYFVMGRRTDTAHVWASGLGFVTGIAGSYAGAMLRLGVDELFRHPNKNPPRRHGDEQD